MLNPQLPLDQTLTALFQEYGLPLGIQPQRATVQYSNKGAQFQCNGALASAKMLKQNPRQLAQAWIDSFSDEHRALFSVLDIAGPGFINISLTAA